MKVTRFTHMLMALTVTLGAWAQGPNGSGTYYQNANALKGLGCLNLLKFV